MASGFSGERTLVGNSLDSMARITSLCFLITILLTTGLWSARGDSFRGSERSLPAIPYFSFLDTPEFESRIRTVTPVIVLSLMLCLVVSTVFASSYSLLLQNALVFLLVAFDRLRLQTWVYNFVGITLIVALFGYVALKSRLHFVLK